MLKSCCITLFLPQLFQWFHFGNGWISAGDTWFLSTGMFGDDVEKLNMTISKRWYRQTQSKKHQCSHYQYLEVKHHAKVDDHQHLEKYRHKISTSSWSKRLNLFSFFFFFIFNFINYNDYYIAQKNIQ